MATIDPTTEPQLSQHPISAAFPAMVAGDFTALMNDIKTNGQRLPIVVSDDQVLDGWHRYRACQQLGIEPKLEEFTGTDPVSFVLSLNLRRRHLTESQRAMVAAELATLGTGRPSTKKGSRDPISTKTAAEALQVGTASVKRAKAVLKHGSPALVADIKTGKVPVATAVKQLKAAAATTTPAEITSPKTTLPAPGTSSGCDRLRVLYSLHDDLFAALEGVRCQVRWADREQFLSVLDDYHRTLESRARSTKTDWKRPLDEDDD